MSSQILPPSFKVHSARQTHIVQTKVVWKVNGGSQHAWSQYAEIGPIVLAIQEPGTYGPSQTTHPIVSGCEYVILVQAPPHIPCEYWVVHSDWAESVEVGKFRVICDVLDHWKAVRRMYDGNRWTVHQIRQAQIIFEKARRAVLKPILAGMPQLQGD